MHKVQHLFRLRRWAVKRNVYAPFLTDAGVGQRRRRRLFALVWYDVAARKYSLPALPLPVFYLAFVEYVYSSTVCFFPPFHVKVYFLFPFLLHSKFSLVLLLNSLSISTRRTHEQAKGSESNKTHEKKTKDENVSFDAWAYFNLIIVVRCDDWERIIKKTLWATGDDVC
jgi:hypothetical protein